MPQCLRGGRRTACKLTGVSGKHVKDGEFWLRGLLSSLHPFGFSASLSYSGKARPVHFIAGLSRQDFLSNDFSS